MDHVVPGFSAHVQMSSLLFSYFCSRSGDIAPAAARVYAPLPEIAAMFTAPILCVPVQLTYMRAPLI